MNLSLAGRASCLAIAIALSAGAAPAQAVQYLATNGGAACHAANGAGASKLSFGNHYVANVGTTDQFVVCQFQMDDNSGSENTIDYLGVNVYTTYGGASVSCVAQTGMYADSVLTVRSSVTRAYEFTGGGSGASITLEWLGGTLTRQSVDDVLTISCKFAPGMRIGLIERTESAGP